MDIYADVVVVGTGVGGLFSALNIGKDKKVVMLTKADAESSDSFLAQGGICVQRDDEDYDGYFEDTMRAGHYENRKESVDIMIRSSREVIADLVSYGVEFEQKMENLSILVKGHIPGRGFCIMRILQEKRLQANYLDGQENGKILRFMNI